MKLRRQLCDVVPQQDLIGKTAKIVEKLQFLLVVCAYARRKTLFRRTRAKILDSALESIYLKRVKNELLHVHELVPTVVSGVLLYIFTR